MALIDWDDSLSVDVEEIDKQHQKLVEMINELNDAMRDRKTHETLGKIIDALSDYTETHFAAEEHYFVKFNYPATIAHKREHKGFIEKVTDVKQGFDEGRLMLSMDIMTFLKEWLIGHINGTDKKYMACFKENGLK